MAYTYTGAVARSKTLDAIWGPVDLSAVDINAIYATYSKAYITLTHPSLVNPVYLDMDTVRLLIGVYTGTKTLTQWLAANGNNTLPTITSIPQLNPKPVLYNDAWHAGYSIKPVDRTKHPDAELPFGAKNDLLLSKPGLDFRQWWRYVLVTVNGYFHRVGGSVDGLYVVDGGRTGRLANDNIVGIHSFREVGALEVIPIIPSMIYKTNPDQKYANAAHIALPRSTEGKTVLLVLGGFLHVLDDAYKMIGDRSMKIDFNNYAFPERIYDSFKALGLEKLGLETSVNNELQFVVEQLYSDAVIEAYLTLSQSFIVVVDTPTMYVRRHDLEKTGLPGRFNAPAPFKRFPLISALGRVYDYRIFPEDGQCILATPNALDIAYNFQTTPWEAELSIDPTRSSAAPWRFAKGHLLEFGRFG